MSAFISRKASGETVAQRPGRRTAGVFPFGCTAEKRTERWRENGTPSHFCGIASHFCGKACHFLRDGAGERTERCRENGGGRCLEKHYLEFETYLLV